MLDLRRLGEVEKQLGEAVIDPSLWPSLMEATCRAVSATAAILLQSDVRTPDVPRTEAAKEFFDSYFRNDLHLNDVRAIRGVPLLMRGYPVVSDQDIFESERDVSTDPLYANCGQFGLKWWAVVGFRAGSSLWGFSLQRSPREGLFDDRTKQALARLAGRLTETATLSKAVGMQAIGHATQALELLSHPSIGLDRLGHVTDINASASKLLGEDIRIVNRRVFIRDPQARRELEQLTDQLRYSSENDTLITTPIVVSRRSKRPIVIRMLPVLAAASNPFLGSRAILLLKDLDSPSRLDPELIGSVLKLTPAQARIASLLAEGKSTEEIALQQGIGLEGVRAHLKAIFARTDTHRQAELIALLRKL
jgi:DNA-binding CsgD family transcriptional regulator